MPSLAALQCRPIGTSMAYRTPDLQERQNAAAEAKKQLLERFRAAAQNPGLADKLAERAKIHEARMGRLAEREAARKAHEAELAVQAAREAELAAAAQREADRLAAIAAEEEVERQRVADVELKAAQKARRDERYAARKAAKN